ncbi:MAG: HD domain-containing protein [Thermodesulfovibrionales bacterium]|nr:HD domain-containing protein [Thermodesulfovibrionales bacterium]
MINRQYFLDWFNAFCEGFYEDLDEHNKNYKLKFEHTLRVCDNAEKILMTLEVEDYLKDLCWLTCLTHDLGRFPQYKQYRTFKDSISINHGVLSSKIIEDERLLNNLSEQDRSIVIQAVKFHNAYQIPFDISDTTKFALKLVRDADKLDIWKVFIDHYSDSNSEKPSALGLGFPDKPFISESIIEGIKRHEIVKLSDVVTLNDVKLLQLSWIFDINFKETYRIFEQRRYLNAIVNTITDKTGLDNCIEIIRNHIRNCL